MRKVLVPIVLFLVLTYVPLLLASAKDDEEYLPKEWLGKGKVVDRVGEYVRVVFIHYAKNKDLDRAFQDITDVDDPDGDGKDSYQLLGVYWNLSKYQNGVSYVINPTGGVKQGLKESEIVDEIKAALESWDLAVDLSDSEVDYVAYPGFEDVGSFTNVTYKVELFNDTPRVDYKAKASISRPDYKNIITWGRAQAGVVAYTVVWYTSTNEIVDADIVLNSLYKWGIADGNETTSDLADKFDIGNIVTHEAGHMCGLDDIYDSNYSAMTMYGYSSYGEEIKRSLEPGDIAGVQVIYSNWRAQ